MKLKNNQDLPFYLLLIGVFFILISPNFLSHGMFLDGVTYSAIAKNLADGIGSFWNLQYTQTMFPEFHEHPPLAIGIQSVFYTVFGDGRLIDKLYSLFTIIITAIGIVAIWRHFKLKHSWLPLVLWISVTLVIWTTSNNLLENTLSIFLVFSVLFYLKSENSYRYLFLFLSGFLLALGFLTKGFVALYPWVFPFLYWIFFKKRSFSYMMVDTLVVVFSTILPITLLMLICTDARENLIAYFDIQVVNSLKNVVTVNSRFYILKRVLLDLIPPLFLCGLVVVWARVKKYHFHIPKGFKRMGLVFILLGFSGVFPIMISMKQRSFYVLPSFIFFSIGLGLLIYPQFQILFKNFIDRPKNRTLFKWIGGVVFGLGTIMLICFSNAYNRDKQDLEDFRIIFSVVPRGDIVNFPKESYHDYKLHAYCQRFYQVALDSSRIERIFFIETEVEIDPEYLSGYELVPLPTQKYHLYKKKEIQQMEYNSLDKK